MRILDTAVFHFQQGDILCVMAKDVMCAKITLSDWRFRNSPTISLAWHLKDDCPFLELGTQLAEISTRGKAMSLRWEGEESKDLTLSRYRNVVMLELWDRGETEAGEEFLRFTKNDFELGRIFEFSGWLRRWFRQKWKLNHLGNYTRETMTDIIERYAIKNSQKG